MDFLREKLNPLKLFRLDAVLIDNPIFKLHHQGNFFLVLFGVVFTYGINYLDKNAIICDDKDLPEFTHQYCWLHGSGHIPSDLHGPDLKCQADQVKNGTPNERHTHYYLWVPFVLTLLLAVIKIPRSLWKALEGGFVKSIIGDGDPEKIDPEKIGQKIKSKKWKKKARRYNYNYALCEILNIFCIILCFIILNALVGNGKKHFWKYGTDVFRYEYNLNEKYEKDEDYWKTRVSPRCNLFPTEVSCNVKTGGIDKGVDVDNTLCILSNNLFNQYYFIILWFWWTILLAISAGGFVYRLAQILSEDVSKQIFIFKTSLDVEDVENLGKYSQEEYFLLGRICQNLKGSQIQKLMKKLEHSESLNSVTTAEEKTDDYEMTEKLLPKTNED